MPGSDDIEADLTVSLSEQNIRDLTAGRKIDVMTIGNGCKIRLEISKQALRMMTTTTVWRKPEIVV